IDQPLTLEFQNFGNGPAIDVRMVWTSGTGLRPSSTAFSAVKKFFAQGGLVFSENDNSSLEIYDPERPGRWTYIMPLGGSVTAYGPFHCSSGKLIDQTVRSDSMYAAAIDIATKQLDGGKNETAERTDTIVISYATI